MTNKWDEVRYFSKKWLNQKNVRIKYLQTDNGGELCNIEFDNYLKSCSIRRRLTVPYKPQ